MASDFLLKEYELSFTQLRYYDDRSSTLLTYLFSLTSAVATAQFAVYKLIGTPTQGFFQSQAFLSFLVFMATVLLFLGMLQNRLYFVYVARQINAIRGYMMQTEAGGFENNQMYTSTSFPALKPMSIHTIQLVGASMISAVFAGSSVYAAYPALGRPTNLVAVAWITVSVFLAEAIGGALYLAVFGKKSADKAVHGTENQ